MPQNDHLKERPALRLKTELRPMSSATPGKKARVLLMTPNLEGVKDGLNRIQPPLGFMIIGSVLRQNGHGVALHDRALGRLGEPAGSGFSKSPIGQTDGQIAEVGIRKGLPERYGSFPSEQQFVKQI